MLNGLFPQSFVLFKRFNIRFDIGLNVFLMNLMYYRNTYYNVSNIRVWDKSIESQKLHSLHSRMHHPQAFSYIKKS